ncbi:uncharacterized protein ANIA_11122 [Aspergillus nidulans FGSC A4]|uniref:Uncharacterized protein n=1 Tax=Emericella nidulans (strain FGSC A4 / ATCC 38163 / CBS 112.46 / NRRL 194 / M139) TaxID=227321 RepID=C8V9R6_EMENI|nr:hypothetical protein [Aspergillus nidulans FGSC A4]CBF78048.1 TPA: conserved hypothetical protein [Aspergillus nidulans FGSC A4]
MVSLRAVRAHNASLKSLGANLVAVFVGGTSGISLSTALSLARHTVSPTIYLIGQSRQAAESAVRSIRALNPSAEAIFLLSDISLMKNVDQICKQIESRGRYVNIVFMTPGYLTLRGRDETTEGLDRKFALHYYARMRFVNRLLPLLESAADKIPSASLKCGHHASLMTNFYLEEMARRYKNTSFVHAYPSGVNTGILRGLPGGQIARSFLSVLLKPFMVPLEESGERHLFAATSRKFPCAARGKGTDGDQEDVAPGSGGRPGSGCYWVNWDGEVFPEHASIKQKRAEGAVERVVEHTEEVLRRVCENSSPQ